MAKIVQCKAKNKDTCRFHGALEHAEMNVAMATLEYVEAKAAVDAADPETLKSQKTRWNTTQVHPLKSRLASKKTKLAKAYAELDSLPGQFEILEEKVKALTSLDNSPQDNTLRARYNKARTLQARKKEEELARKRAEREALKLAEEKKALFEQIKAEVELAKNSTDEDTTWRSGYKRAVSKAIVENGSVVHGPGKHQYGTYYAALNPEGNVHLQQCGSLDVRNIEEKAWEDWDYNSMASVQTSTTRYRVEAQVTCNCGELTCEPIEMDGTFREVLDSVLKF